MKKIQGLKFRKKIQKNKILEKKNLSSDAYICEFFFLSQIIKYLFNILI